MPQIGPLEIMVVLVIALVVFGPEKLPDLARTVGRTLIQLRKMADEVKSEFDVGLGDLDEDIKSFGRDKPRRPSSTARRGSTAATTGRARREEVTTPKLEQESSVAEDVERLNSDEHVAPAVGAEPTSRQAPPPPTGPSSTVGPTDDGGRGAHREGSPPNDGEGSGGSSESAEPTASERR
jgi:Tat protein translocase TatB subunit